MDRLRISRRQALGMLGVPLLAARLGPSARFTRPLAIPKVLSPARRDETTDYYEVSQRESAVEILPGIPTRVWSYEGTFPGPTIRATRGRRASLRHTNLLDVHTVVHLHGGVTAADSDGYPTDMVMPNQSATYVYENQGRAATLWYHDHAMDHTGRNIYMGLLGTYLLEDPQEAALNLPREEFDVPLMLDDRAFMADGTFHFRPGMGHMSGAMGDTMLVNGVAWPKLDVAARKYRFRVVNSSNARAYRLALSSGRPLIQIATEGGLLPEPVVHRSIPLAMGERVEIVIDFSDYSVGDKIALLNLNAKSAMREIMRFDVTRKQADDSSVPNRLAAIERLDPKQSAHTRKFGFGPTLRPKSPAVSWTINGRRFHPDHAIAECAYGETEIWELHNRMLGPFGMLHPVHVHMVNFQILERNGGPPKPWETGWKDTISLDLGESAKVIMKFEPYRGRYLMHCHNLEHEDHAMMARYDVV